jgi:hypothetical protein
MASAGVSVPYLQVSDRARTKWKRMMPNGPGVRIGIAWDDKDNRASFRDPYCHGSLPLDLLRPLTGLADVRLFNLQRARQGESDFLDRRTAITDWHEQIDDLSDLSAFVEQMDIIIAVNCPAAHIAGALGKPVLVMLPFTADWRWMQNRSDSPWYPTMRLFRQERPGAWDVVVEGVVRHVEALLRQGLSRHQVA